MSRSDDAYEARDLSRFAELYWELRCPERPRFVEDLLRVALPGGDLHVLGGEAQVIQGASLPWVMENLVPLLDGTRTVGDVEAAFPGIAASDLRDAIHLMHMHGMLEEGEGAAADEADEPRRAQRAFFSRYLRRTGRNRSRGEAQRALEAARVRALGDEGEPLAGMLVAMLREAGVADVRLAASAGELARGEVDLAVAIGDQAALEAAARACIAARVPMLAANPGTWTIGPLTIPGASACPACVRLQVAAAAADPALEDAAQRALWGRALVSRVAQHAIFHASGLLAVTPLEHVEVWRPGAGETALHVFMTRLPSCPLCGGDAPPRTATLPSGHAESRARMFHNTTVVQPWHIGQHAGMQAHISPEVRKLQSTPAAPSPRRPPEGAGTQVATPAATQVATSIGAAFGAPAGVALSRRRDATGTLDAGALGALLELSFGGRVERRAEGEAHVRRTTASAGNLGSAEAYVAVARVAGIAAGVHRFELAARGLTPLRGGVAAGALARAALAGGSAEHAAAVESAGAVIVVVGSVARACSKYYARGYTYALLDAGLMAHRVELLAQELGLAATTVWAFDDEVVARVVGVDGIDLAPHLLIALRGAATEARDVSR
ncbi:SagB family peptide dehydrogenase [Sorangium sp. So ce388]|uniref:SagB family peptide dehydrogenase n=1 Tax=Sorangium sp. So ce388 TaxID=3133309 RepID=UPI003F5C1355